MDDATKERFEKIAAGSIERAESVPCSMADFVEGLGIVAAYVGERQLQALSEIAGRGEDEAEIAARNHEASTTDQT